MDKFPAIELSRKTGKENFHAIGNPLPYDKRKSHKTNDLIGAYAKIFLALRAGFQLNTLTVQQSLDTASMNRLILLLFLFLFPVQSKAQEIDESLFNGYDTAFVLYNRSSDNMISIDTARAAQRLAPCSTFKIYNTLIGLELELIEGPDDPWYTWDGVRRSYEAWNKDLTLREAFRVSAVSAFQVLARRIGLERMKPYMKRIGYGSMDISAGIDVFWLYHPERETVVISADEQVVLLNKLLDGKLPFSDSNVETLYDVMRVTKTEKGTLYGKTGSGMDAEGDWKLGWFVGFVESRGNIYVFACNVIGGESPSGKEAKAIVERVLNTRGLL
ncbi:penicillin-binding transpeptidase domain-containing protein [Prosthecochloris sp.]|uniref:penicillin-binding transpeptidase domain-containing protein n=1 Tax=Prosthecochloris sp. TaxID=290513 RepID=UPI0025F7CBCB|nr:penicillin-binding transpeptidase domain-containing protein [Prosthecochloris sp.]